MLTQNPPLMKFIGIDIGSISVNTVVINEEKQILHEYYDYCHGKPYKTFANRLSSILKNEDHFSCKIAFTGTGGRFAAKLLNGFFVNEIIAQSRSVAELYPQVRTIIEVGGEDSKLIYLENNRNNGSTRLSEFVMNNLCAAGTGSFLDQQAKRIGVSIEKEFGELALQSVNPPRIAGRCSVFAKSDMIHLQQIATPVHDIICGLCFAVARNLKSTLGKGKKVEKPMIFQGGVAANKGMERAFREVYDLTEEELIIPKHYAAMGAIGAVFHTMSSDSHKKGKIHIDKIYNHLQKQSNQTQFLSPLNDGMHRVIKSTMPIHGKNKIKAYMGIDVGSLSTNLVVIDEQHNVIARRYLPTAGKPLEAIKKGLDEIGSEVANKIEVAGVGTTGSGRYLTGDFVGADTIQNEITCQATAAIEIDPEVDTIFEIGGQDSKYISIANGVIINFEMNKVCAAGTGSFLEEQADKLGICIAEEFGKLGLSAKNPVKLGERCTVFMESDLNSHQQKGTNKDNLVAGLAYSIVYNYLNRVVRDKPIGKKIFFQGGVTNNKAVLAAFEKVTGKTIHIPPHFDVTGAIGAAILAKRKMNNGILSKFKGFKISKTGYKTKNFVCNHCSNHCEIKMVKIDGETKPLYYGGICERYEVQDKKSNQAHPFDLFKERTELLLDGFINKPNSDKLSIGIPRGLMGFYQQFPFWRHFFEELGFQVIISDETNRKIITDSLETMVSETCLPVEVMHGHVINLLEKEVDYIFVPFVVNAKGDKNNPTNNCNCPWVQSHPFLLKTAFKDPSIREKLLIPTLHFRYFERVLKKELSEYFNKKFNLSKKIIAIAIEKAAKKQEEFEASLKYKGRKILENLSKTEFAFVLVGRPYNTSDSLLNLRIVKKLLNLNILTIPLDYLPLEEENIFTNYPSIYWPNGQRILAGAKYIARCKNLYAIYLGNFRCGPDSFLLHFFKDEMKGKPYLHLEVDEHSADAGMITRIEAFLDSLKGYQGLKTQPSKFETQQKSEIKVTSKRIQQRTIYFPYARDVVHILSAATRHCGIPSEVLPMQDEADIELGRKYTNGQECFPFICTTGSFLKKLAEPGIDPAEVSFFMPDHNGPCRFGLYNRLHRLIFDNLGYKDAEIIHPSNENSYASIAPGYSFKWRKAAWRGLVASDLIRKMLEQTRPYELIGGSSDSAYQKYLSLIIQAVEKGGKGLLQILENAALEFKKIQVDRSQRKPLVAIVGEIFMRDNPYCSNFLVKRLEALGAETLMAPMAEWINYSTIRYIRDSRWKGNIRDLYKAKIQLFFQKIIERRITNSISDLYHLANEIEVEEMLESCNEFIPKDYDGDPPLAVGSSNLLAGKQIDGVVNILPFTCLPGTINSTVSQDLRNKHNGLPWENFAYDGDDNIGLDTRFEAFMHQVYNYYSRKKEYAL